MTKRLLIVLVVALVCLAGCITVESTAPRVPTQAALLAYVGSNAVSYFPGYFGIEGMTKSELLDSQDRTVDIQPLWEDGVWVVTLEDSPTWIQRNNLVISKGIVVGTVSEKNPNYGRGR